MIKQWLSNRKKKNIENRLDVIRQYVHSSRYYRTGDLVGTSIGHDGGVDVDSARYFLSRMPIFMRRLVDHIDGNALLTDKDLSDIREVFEAAQGNWTLRGYTLKGSGFKNDTRMFESARSIIRFLLSVVDSEITISVAVTKS